MTTKPFVNYSAKIAETVSDDHFWNVHDHLKDRRLDELRAMQVCASLPFSVCTLNLTGDLNVGMIVRTACIFGASTVFIFGRRKYDKRSTVGAQNYQDIVRVNGFEDDGETLSLAAFKALIAEHNLAPIFVEQGGTPLERVRWEKTLPRDGRRPCLILGNENEGVPSSFLSLGPTISITQRGVLRSLNVSAAASVVIHALSSYLAGK